MKSFLCGGDVLWFLEQEAGIRQRGGIVAIKVELEIPLVGTDISAVGGTAVRHTQFSGLRGTAVCIQPHEAKPGKVDLVHTHHKVGLNTCLNCVRWHRLSLNCLRNNVHSISK